MARQLKLRTLIAGAAALALLATGALAFTPSAVPHTLADTPSTTTAPAVHRQPTLLPPPGNTLLNPPLLSAVEGVAEVAPGGLVKVDGANLGDGQGSLCMRWSEIIVHNEFTADGQVCLDIVDWQPDRIIASVPDSVIGLTNQTANLVATRSDGPQSNLEPIEFVATLAVVEVSNALGNGSPLYVQCSQAASNTNTCSADPAGATHYNGICCSAADFVGSVGVDDYYLDLHYGWAVRSISLTNYAGDTSIASKAPVGATGGKVSVFWSAGGFRGWAEYGLVIDAIGPAGVPLN